MTAETSLGWVLVARIDLGIIISVYPNRRRAVAAVPTGVYPSGIAAIGLIVVVYLRGKRLPTDWRSIGDLLLLGVVNTVLPFALITWGETRIESGLASVLQGTAALFTLVIAHFTFADERISLRKLAGLLIGFLGVVVLASRSTAETIVQNDSTMHLLGQLAVIVASFCYALGGTYGRKAMQHRLDPVVVAAGAMTVAAVLSRNHRVYGTSARRASADQPRPMTPLVLGAVLALGS